MDTASRDGTAEAEDEPVFALSDLYGAIDRGERVEIVAQATAHAFDAYYAESRAVPRRVQAAFEARRWPEILELSRFRLNRFSIEVDRLAAELKANCPELKRDEAFWRALEKRYVALISGRYEADLAFAFLMSLRRELFEDSWKPIALDAAGALRSKGVALRRFSGSMPVRAADVDGWLEIGRLSANWRDRKGDARLVAIELNRALLRRGVEDGEAIAAEFIDGALFRNRGAYLVGRLAAPGRAPLPVLVAVLNGPSGLYVDAVLHESDQLQYVFSSTLANFHIANPHYHELAAFLHELMPKRPLGLHYSTIGFNHVGKTAVMEELLRERAESGEPFATAPGFRGTVAIGFTAPSSRYVMKIIRDKPAAGYKWGAFAGIEAVLDKYRLVHDADRAGSMLDNVIYSNVTLDRSLFAPELMEELLAAGSRTVIPHGGQLLFRHLVVQMKMVPLPIFLETASRADAERAVVNLGDCIKNNAAVNIFNKDLDGRNYGVSPIMRVYLFDYDAVERLTDVKIRTNAAREDGEEDIPDWFFEEGTVFLPEELMTGLRINDPELRKLFRTAHPELLNVDYWEGMQRALCEGKVPMVRSYPSERRLHRHVLKAYPGASAAAE